ncbi:MAG: NYN domain-containing protein [Clostridia bacterium]|jgi:predicted RNA-binding protein with PIN domain|nr:NYN domain-containing protein [Clostridia bacterium]
MNTGIHYLIVDGYNVINNWPEFDHTKVEDLAHARDYLIQLLSNYQALTGQQVILVFDAHQVEGQEQVEIINGVRIIYSRKGETADAVIERLVYNFAGDNRVTVATSDWLQQRIVLGKGGLRISSRELRELVLQTRQESKRHYRQSENRSTLSGRLGEELRQTLEQLRRDE